MVDVVTTSEVNAHPGFLRGDDDGDWLGAATAQALFGYTGYDIPLVATPRSQPTRMMTQVRTSRRAGDTLPAQFKVGDNGIRQSR